MTEADSLPYIHIESEEINGVELKKKMLTIQGKSLEEAYKYYLKLKND